MHTETDCREYNGVTVSLIDALIAIARALKERRIDPEDPATREALLDLKQDEDIHRILSLV
jgi:hypothetical protein